MSFSQPSTQSSTGAAAQILMPKKRQHGFDLGSSQAPTSSSFTPGANDSKPMGTASSFIDTDILLNDDLWHQISNGNPDLSGFHHSNGIHDFPHSHNGVMSTHDVAMADGRSHYSLAQQSHSGNPESFIDIPQNQSANLLGEHGGSFHSFMSKSSQHDNHSLFDRGGMGLMEEEDSPDGSNGDAASTVATSIISPSSHGTMASSLSKSLQTRHKRSGSSASSQAKGRTGRSISRPNLKTIQDRGAERSPSQDRGGVGKAPTSRSRPSRRASIGPAAQAAVQASVHSHLRIDAQGAAVLVGASGKPEPRSPTLNLSSSAQNGQQRWSMFSGSGEGVHDPMSLQNLTLNDAHAFAWNPTIPHSQPGDAQSASGSLPTPLTFHSSMQQLHLQTPPVPSSGLHSQSSIDEVPRETSAEPYNPFLFPPYAQTLENSSQKTRSEVSGHSQRAGSEASQDLAFLDNNYSVESSSSPARPSPKQAPATEQVEPSKKGGAKTSKGVSAMQPAKAPTRERKSSKAGSQAAATKRALQEVLEEADAKQMAGSDDRGARQDEEEDDGADDDEDEQPLATMSKSEAEAKRLAEKRRRRRESHNAVERRRRDNINEKITELATLLPEAMLLDAIATSTQGGNSGTFAPALAAKAALAAAAAAAARGDTPPDGQGPNGADADIHKSSTAAYAAALAPVHANSAALAAAQAKPNKGIILRKSVEYIRHLQQFLDMQMVRIGFLEAELQRHREVMHCSGMQMPPLATQPVPDLFGFSSAFGDEGSGGFLNGSDMPHEINTHSLMDLGMPPPPGVPHDAMRGPPNHGTAHGDGRQGSLPTTSSAAGDSTIAPAASLADWLDGFDQRTGLPRRSSVDPIEEEDEHEGDLPSRGRGRQPPSSGHEHDDGEEEQRGRSRQRGNATLSHAQQGSWPTLEASGARSPMQLLHDSKDDHLGHRDFPHLNEFKMEA